jgi:hypothetical protein
MTNAQRYHFADFTRDNYAKLLKLARQTYAFRRFTDFDPGERFVLWRHDVDVCPRAAVKLAEREAAEGVGATYFVMLRSEFYNLLDPEATSCVRAIAGLGHEIGLHIDLSCYPTAGETAFVRALAAEARAVAELMEVDCRVFSFHNPDARAAAYRDRLYAGLLNASAEYFYTAVGFCSDSNGYWRTRRLEDVLRQATDERLHVLTHPEMWQDAVMSPRQRISRCIDGRTARTGERYDQLLREHNRENVDWE